MKELLERYPSLAVCKDDILRAKDVMIDCYQKGGKLLLCGNGGSSADCDHIVGELMKGFLRKRPLRKDQKDFMLGNCPEIEENVLDKLQNALPAISLPAFTALNTAVSNDIDPELIYAQGVLGLATKNDVLLAISTSGNARNVLEAAKIAKGLGIKVIALSGNDGGLLRVFSDICIVVPEKETYKIQELHLPIYHYLCAAVESFFM